MTGYYVLNIEMKIGNILCPVNVYRQTLKRKSTLCIYQNTM